MSRKIVSLLSMLMATVAMTGVGLAQTKDKPLVLNYADIEPAGTIRTRNVEWWINEIEKRTNGAVKIRPYWAGALVGGKDIPIGVAKGYPEMGSNVYIYDASFVPALGVFDLPVAKTSVGAIRAFADMVQNDKTLRAELHKRKMIGLTVFGHHGPSMAVTTKPVAGPADVKGLRLRSPGGLRADILRAMGAEVVTMGAADVYTALQRGTVDGLSSSVKDIYEWKWTDYAKFGWSLGIPLGPPLIYVINEDVWNGISPEMQKIILQTSAEFLDKQIADYEAGLSEFFDKMKANGVTFKEIPQITAVSQKVSDEGVQIWVTRMKEAGVPGQELLDAFRKTLSKYE
ncbi:TRAP transporter substrate-binding protein DctP [Alsobacter sp. SYSU M60028]|uniref:TRAP transporter substrate-binding protein DctP n=1 Tax=Alsobacter ponti TaxID=2962936 RepID=A0ABT1L8I0_9HYPH|nr:TRAP transporter substrate-binding protein DctP [Alsobacter ponti]MCP8937759.1 TRAP transporter substrate-binding protein DctP [Alsobacter ponti]